MQREHYTLISVGPVLLKFTERLPGRTLYHLHHGLVDGPAFRSVGTAHGRTRSHQAQLVMLKNFDFKICSQHKNCFVE